MAFEIRRLVFAPSREEWENMREKLRKVKLLDASKLTHKIKLNFTFYGDSLVARLYDDPKKSALAANTRRQSILEATVSNFHSRLHIRTKPVGKQGWGGQTRHKRFGNFVRQLDII